MFGALLPTNTKLTTVLTILDAGSRFLISLPAVSRSQVDKRIPAARTHDLHLRGRAARLLLTYNAKEFLSSHTPISITVKYRMLARANGNPSELLTFIHIIHCYIPITFPCHIVHPYHSNLKIVESNPQTFPDRFRHQAPVRTPAPLNPAHVRKYPY